MQYLLVIYSEESHWERQSETERSAVLQQYMDFTKDIAKSGHYRAGNELHPTSQAKTVRVRNNDRLITDGPFAKTKEQLGGYYLIDAKDIGEAVAIAARIPSAKVGSIEVRPIIPHDLP